MEQMPSNAPIMESKPGPAGWLPVWIKAVTKPNEQTFIEITEHPDASSRTAFIWMFIAGTFSGIIQAIVRAVALATGVQQTFWVPPGMEQYLQGTPLTSPEQIMTSLVIGVCASPIAGVVTILFFALGTAIIQWIAKLFGGTGSFEKLAYALAAITVPFTLVSAVATLLTLIPFVGACVSLLSIGLSLYVIVLEVMAVKGVNRFGWGQAIGSVLIPGLVVGISCCCLVFVGASLLGPAIGDVFDQINQSLAP